MSVLTVREFRQLLGTLDRAAFGRFVADLWAARGWTTERAGDVVVARREGREVRILVRHHARVRARVRGWLAAPAASSDDGVGRVDVVATSRLPKRTGRIAVRYGADVVGPADLYDAALYGVPRPDCEALFERHFGRSVASSAAGGTSWLRARRAVAVGAMALLALTVAAATAPHALGPASPAASGDGPSATPAGATRTTTGGAPPAPAAPATNANASRQPRGLAAAHARVLRNTSLTVGATRRWEYPNGTPFARHSLRAAVAADRSRYAVTLTRAGDGARGFDRGALYSGGPTEPVYRAVVRGNETRYELLRARGRPSGPRGLLSLDPVYVEALPPLLDAIDSSDVSLKERDPPVDDRRWAPVTVGNLLGRGPSEDPLTFEVRASLSADAVERIAGYGPVENATLTAVVDSRGRFYSYRVTYATERDGTPLVASRTVRFENVGGTVVEPPDWIAAARNDTGRVEG